MRLHNDLHCLSRRICAQETISLPHPAHIWHCIRPRTYSDCNEGAHIWLVLRPASRHICQHLNGSYWANMTLRKPGANGSLCLLTTFWPRSSCGPSKPSKRSSGHALPPFLKVNFIASYSFVMYWYIMYCYIMYCYMIYHPSSRSVSLLLILLWCIGTLGIVTWSTTLHHSQLHQVRWCLDTKDHSPVHPRVSSRHSQPPHVTTVRF